MSSELSSIKSVSNLIMATIIAIQRTDFKDNIF
uniref:Uncharacterized protein n=1 Tax=Arundo donax TaxID=35708 RepID=A0A0A9AL82_ARUDO